MSQQLIFTNHVFDALDNLVDNLGNPATFVLVDSNTFESVLPLFISQSKAVNQAKVITIPAGDTNKNIDALQHVWQQLSSNGATRGSVIINIGGGMVTDLGGFAASTFKRGIHFINVPTTLLGAVDASVGGKTGINFNGLKNEIGAFCEAEAVIINTEFLNTLPMPEVLSGYAEMLKHGLLDDKATFADLLNYDITDSEQMADPDKLLDLLQRSVMVKKDIVDVDPTEQGLRRALNLGHTVGHAFESYAIERKSPIPHGYAVAWGIAVELILSNMKMGFPTETLQQYVTFVKENYGTYPLQCSDYDALIQLMSHDKKNPTPDKINFTLLSDVGDIHIDQIVSADEIKAAMDIYRDLFEY